MSTVAQIKSAHAEMRGAELLRAPVEVLRGVSPAAAKTLQLIGATTVFDLATSQIFERARRAAKPSSAEAILRADDLVPGHLLDRSGDRARRRGDGDELGRLPLVALNGVGERLAKELTRDLGVESIGDLAAWPPFLTALAIAGLDDAPLEHSADPEIPDELVPKLNEHASEKSFYSVYTIDPSPGGQLPQLDGEIDLGGSISKLRPEIPRTGTILRYEQSWTPVALSLGNLLHSLALAPGESTRIAMVDWSRRQGVRTTEDISQLESLANSLTQNRTVNEVTRAIAREAQSGFSNINANSTVSNSAYTSYGMQNPGEVVDATIAGALLGGAAGAGAGGVAGAGIGGVAGAIVGGVALAETVVGVPAGIALGGIIGAAGGGAIGAGAGGIIGGTAGGVAGMLGTAQFGSSVDSGSNTTLDVVTTTSSSGTRDVAGEMLQNIADRTHQHSSSSRNRRASIVQEVTQSETEKVSTRVVTNYNHMHALTIQYFEVVQQYAVRTTLVSRQPCLYVPVKPITRWTEDLVNRYRDEILSVALTHEVAFSLATATSTVTVTLPTYARIPLERLRKADRTLLPKARKQLDAFISADPFNGWRLPDSMYLSWVFGVMEAGGGGPLGGLGGPNEDQLSHKLMATLRTGEQMQLKLGELEEKHILLADIARIEYVVRPKARVPRDLAGELAEPRYGTMKFLFRSREGSWEEDPDNTITFEAHYAYAAEDIRDGELTIPVVDFSHAQSLASVLAHLNANSSHYSFRILRSRRNSLRRQLLSGYSWNGKPLLDVVDQDPVAVSGNSLVFLLHDATARPQRPGEPAVGSIRSEEIVPIGTGGVFAEAVQGRANAAERLDLGRFWDWQDSPIPIVAPEIAPVTLGSRAMAADVRPGSLDAALVQAMTPRGLPDPQGLVSSLGAVSQQMFRDMSGIAEAARVAQTSLQEAMSGATASGEAASENLRAGMEQTRAVLEQVIGMNEKFATLLAEQGFGLMTDAAKGALGSALGGGSGGLGSLGGAGVGGIGNVLGGSSGAATGSGSTRSGGSLAQRNASIAGAILNRAAGHSTGSGVSAGGAATPGAAVAPGGGSPVPSAGAGGGRETSGYLVPSSGDLEGRILGELGGLPASGAVPAGSTAPRSVGGVPPVIPQGGVEALIRSRLLPGLAGVADSDEALFQGIQTALDLMADLELRGDDSGDVRSAALTRLVPAWNAAVDRAVADFNGGDSAAIHRLDRLLAIQGAWPQVGGTTTSHEVIDRLQASVSIEEVSAPDKVEGGEMVTIGARIMMHLPDGSTRPAAGAPVHLVAYPSVQENLSGVADADGRVSFTFRHGVPDYSLPGVPRFAGFVDLEVYLSASAPFSILISNSIKHVIPGAIAITLEEAISDDDGSTALIGSVVHARVGVPVLLNFRATKAGQPLQGRSIKELKLNGAGTADTTRTDTQGGFTVTYLATSGSGTVAYLSPVIETSDVDTAAGMATIQIL